MLLRALLKSRLFQPIAAPLTGRIVGSDPKPDISVVKLEKKELPVPSLADSSKLKGDFA
jgi:S1-C subfamily serine protease